MATTQIGSAGVTFPDSSVQASAATPAVTVRTYTAPATWTKPASIKAVRVTIFGAGGNGGTTSGGVGGAISGAGGAGGTAIGTYSAPAIIGPIAVSVGAAGSASPSTFGALISATAGATAPNTGHGAPSPTTWNIGSSGAGGVGSGGQINFYGNSGTPGSGTQVGSTGGGNGWSPLVVGMAGAPRTTVPGSPGTFPGTSQGGTNGGGSGGASANPGGGATGGNGGAGYIVVEEFY